MKKGSKMKKCEGCGRGVYWLVPDGTVFGIPTANIKKITDFKMDRRGRNWCIECYNARQTKGEHDADRSAEKGQG